MAVVADMETEPAEIAQVDLSQEIDSLSCSTVNLQRMGCCSYSFLYPHLS